MFMHNGGLGGWTSVKRRLSERLADRWFLGVVGGTDSEWSFALFLDTLERMGYDPSSQPDQGFGPTVLRRATLKTIEIINELIDQIPESLVHAENIDTRSLLNFAITDGHSVICTRYISSSTDEAASLYYSSGTQWETRATPGSDRDYQMERRDKGADVVLVASEPLTFERGQQLPVLSWFGRAPGTNKAQRTGSTCPPTRSSPSTARRSWCTPSSTPSTAAAPTTSAPPPSCRPRAWPPTRSRPCPPAWPRRRPCRCPRSTRPPGRPSSAPRCP